MSKETIKLELNGKIIGQKKFDPNSTLESIRAALKDKIKDGSFIDTDGNTMDRDDEKNFKLSEILYGNILKIKSGSMSTNEGIQINLNGKNFCVINISQEENLDKLRNSLSSKIQDFSFIDEDGNEQEKDDEKEFQIKEFLKDGVVKIKSNLTTLPAPIPSTSSNVTIPVSNNKALTKPTKKVNYNLSDYELLEDKNGVKFYLYSKVQCQKPHEMVIQYFFDKYGPSDYKDAKIILFVGKTGDGKTTAINAFFNIIKGITLDDDFRFILIKEPEKEKKQAESQTDGVHLYYIRDKDNKPIIIIDSQGFGDTRGKAKDEEVLKAFEHIFSSVIDHINAACFIVKATDCRLDIQIKYIFNKVTGLFSEDICYNFFVLATHAGKDAIDGPPNMIKTLQTDDQFAEIKNKMQTKWFYAVDSTCIMEKDKDKLALFSVAQLNELYQEKIILSRPISVKKCSEVLKGRNELNIQVNNLSTTFKNLLSQQNNLKEQEKNIEIKSKEINELEQKIEFEREKFKNLRGKDLEKALNDLNEEVSRRIYELGNKEDKQQVRTLKEGSSGEEYSHCKICKENCHDPCDCFHLFTSRCTIYPVFGSDCERCGHAKEHHSRDKYRYCWEYIYVKSINEDEIKKAKLEKQKREQQIKESMNAENNKKTNIEKMIETLQDQINDLEDQKLEIVKKKSELEAKIKETNNNILFIIVRLQSISQRISDLAMNNNYIQKDNEYIDSLIDKYNEVYGNDNEKVKELEEMKRRNEQFQKACQLNKEEIFNLDDSQLADLLKNMDF